MVPNLSTRWWRKIRKNHNWIQERYFLPDKRNQHIVFTYKLKEGAEEAIYEKLSDICVSMKAEDYLKLPERINIIPIYLPKEAKENMTNWKGLTTTT